MVILKTVFLRNWQKLTYLAADTAHLRGRFSQSVKFGDKFFPYIVVLFLCGGVQHCLDSSLITMTAQPVFCGQPGRSVSALLSLADCGLCVVKVFLTFLSVTVVRGCLPPHTVCLEQQHVSGLCRQLDIFYSNKWYFLYLYCCFSPPWRLLLTTFLRTVTRLKLSR